MAFNLRFHRTQRGLSGDAVAKMLNCARSSISRLENGEAKLDESQAAKLDEAWNTGGLFGVMLWYATLGHDPHWFKTFTEFEARSSMIHNYDGQLIPALFQTRGYARALLVAGRNQDVERYLEKRLARQEILNNQNPPDLWVLLSESAIDLPVGGPKVMKEQLAHLLELSELPHVTLRVVPKSAGAHEGLDGPFKVITVRQGEVGFIEAPNGGRLVLDASEVRGLRLRFDRIGAVALPIDSSRSLITQLMETMT
jgi:transcriptional regulator with XRE-family HTH domain